MSQQPAASADRWGQVEGMSNGTGMLYNCVLVQHAAHLCCPSRSRMLPHDFSPAALPSQVPVHRPHKSGSHSRPACTAPNLQSSSLLLADSLLHGLSSCRHGCDRAIAFVSPSK